MRRETGNPPLFSCAMLYLVDNRTPRSMKNGEGVDRRIRMERAVTSTGPEASLGPVRSTS